MKIAFLLAFTETLKCWDWPTWRVVRDIIKPATAEQKCSYVELVAPAGTTSQKPKWFVSHWWGEAVFDFITCLSQHQQDRNQRTAIR